MNNISCMWSRCGLFWMVVVLSSICMLVTAHGTSWASTTPKISAGYYHTVALKSDGTVWAFGNNEKGQLGDGTYTNRNTPVQVSGFSGATAIAGGSGYTIALKYDGTVWAWGNNDSGQLQITELSDVTVISGGAAHTIAIKSDGNVWTCGQNGSGQLGDGTYTDRNSPVQARFCEGCRICFYD